MKLNGEVVENDNIVLVVIPRKKRNLAFYFKPVLNWEKQFDSLCKQPQPPKVRLPNGTVNPKFDDPKYREATTEYIRLRSAYVFLQSISQTEGLEWSKVKLEDPSTWLLWTDELTEAGFTQPEQNALFEGYLEANSLSDDCLDKARATFLQQLEYQTVQVDQSSPSTELQSTPSGTPAND